MGLFRTKRSGCPGPFPREALRSQKASGKEALRAGGMLATENGPGPGSRGKRFRPQPSFQQSASALASHSGGSASGWKDRLSSGQKGERCFPGRSKGRASVQKIRKGEALRAGGMLATEDGPGLGSRGKRFGLMSCKEEESASAGKNCFSEALRQGRQAEALPQGGARKGGGATGDWPGPRPQPWPGPG